MSSELKNLSEFEGELPNGKGKKIGIVRSIWNSKITNTLYQGALEALHECGVEAKDIKTIEVPGTFELPLGAQKMALKNDLHAVITLGCVIQGETPHFDFICQAAAQGITQVGLKYNKPVIFGVLTTLTQEQAQERAGGKHGNKGYEAAITALYMA